MTSKIYYSATGRSYTGAHYAPHNVGGMSRWQINVRENGHISETLLDDNYSGERDPNPDEIREWAWEHNCYV